MELSFLTKTWFSRCSNGASKASNSEDAHIGYVHRSFAFNLTRALCLRPNTKLSSIGSVLVRKHVSRTQQNSEADPQRSTITGPSPSHCTVGYFLPVRTQSLYTLCRADILFCCASARTISIYFLILYASTRSSKERRTPNTTVLSHALISVLLVCQLISCTLSSMCALRSRKCTSRVCTVRTPAPTSHTPKPLT